MWLFLVHFPITTLLETRDFYSLDLKQFSILGFASPLKILQQNATTQQQTSTQWI